MSARPPAFNRPAGGSTQRTVIEHGGARYSVLTRRGTARESLIFLHGLGDSAEIWRQTIDHMALAEYGCIAVDLPGFGNSPQRPDGPVSLAAEARNVADLIHTYRDRGVVVVGHGLGGVMGTLIAERRPKWLRTLVNVAGNLTPADCTVSAGAADTADIETWLRDFRERMRADPPPRTPDVATRLSGVDPPTFQALARGLVALSAEARIGERYCALTVPHVYVRGSRDISLDSLSLLRHHAEHELVIEGAGHWVMRERGDEFAGGLAAAIVAQALSEDAAS